jgi:probable F420-dependent oxidoreductase
MRFALFMIESPYRPHVGPSGSQHSGEPTAALTDPTYLAGVAQYAEELGFGAMLFPEHVVLPVEYESRYPYQPYEEGAFKRYPFDMTTFPEPMTALAFVAAVTTRIRLGTSVLILPQRNPVILAKQIATLDALSRGRVSLAVGVGWFREEFEAIGAPWARRGRRADEYMQAMRTLWRDEEATFEGETVRFHRIRCLPKPAQPGGVPLIVGGHSEAAARRAGILGDGYMPIVFAGAGGDQSDTMRLIDVMRSAAKEAGRDPAALEVWTGGPPERAAVERLEAAGVTQMHFPFSEPDLDSAKRRLEQIAAAVIAR